MQSNVDLTCDMTQGQKVNRSTRGRLVQWCLVGGPLRFVQTSCCTTKQGLTVPYGTTERYRLRQSFVTELTGRDVRFVVVVACVLFTGCCNVPCRRTSDCGNAGASGTRQADWSIHQQYNDLPRGHCQWRREQSSAWSIRASRCLVHAELLIRVC